MLDRGMTRLGLVTFIQLPLVCHVHSVSPSPASVLSAHVSQKRQPQRTHYTHSHNRPTRNNNLPIRQTRARIPQKMPQPIKTMVRERKRQPGLDENLRQNRPGCERRREGRALEMPAEEGGDEVEGAVGVDHGGQGCARDAIEGAAVPGYLGAIDREMGGDGAVEALGGEDFLAGGLGHCGGCGLSGGRVSIWWMVMTCREVCWMAVGRQDQPEVPSSCMRFGMLRISVMIPGMAPSRQLSYDSDPPISISWLGYTSPVQCQPSCISSKEQPAKTKSCTDLI